MSKFALLFLMIFFGGTIATFMISGSVSFFLYQVIYFLNPDNRWWSADIPGISYSFIAAFLMILSLAVGYRKYTEQAPWSEQPLFKWLLALLAVYYIVGFWAINPAVHDRFVYDLTKLVVVVLVAYKLVYTPRLLDGALWAYLAGATYIGYLATITGRNSGNRVEGIGLVDAPDANGVASALVPSGVLLMYYAWMGSYKVKMLCALCGGLIANGLVLINSRGSFVGVVASAGLFLMYMLFSRYQKKGQRGMAVLIIIFGISGGLYVADEGFWERMRTLQNPKSEASGSGRIDYWLASIEVARDNPVGLGVQGFNAVATAYLPPEDLGGNEYKSVHSMWFQGLTEVGWLGLCLMLMALLSLYRMSRKAKRWVLSMDENVSYFKLLALECSLLGYLGAASFINQFRAEILYWMMLLLAAGINVYYLQRVKSQEKGKKRVPVKSGTLKPPQYAREKSA
ncbi:O-antigen ligase [Marinobacter segnicrescens]|uniref:O-antigen ligase n=1 Tax=Marinobacter segnicrescens TaxID=430453 RepID=A0A1I0GZH3_9GAMM|nr:O-antigen ligase family protein [Marinobacter segnicrescens]SET76842.1 O-antigen ligase [Marinobacter segnicrescens]